MGGRDSRFDDAVDQMAMIWHAPLRHNACVYMEICFAFAILG